MSLSTLSRLVCEEQVVPGPVGKSILALECSVFLGRGTTQMSPLKSSSICDKGGGVGKGTGGKGGQPWWEETISISVVTYLCSDLVMWS